MTTTPDSQPTSTVTALEVLKELEWSGFGQTAGGFTSICPMCGGFNPTIWKRGKPHFDSEVGHTPTCRLAQALATDTTAERVAGLEPPGCPVPGACSRPGGEAELAKRLGEAKRDLSAANARIAALEAKATDLDSYAHQLQIALTRAAGGGSENFVRHGAGFRADIRACLDKISERESNKHDVMLQYARRAKIAEAALHADKPAVASTEGGGTTKDADRAGAGAETDDA